MPLILFHRVLIGAAILFCAGFAVWQFLAFRAHGGVFTLLIALGFAAAAAALAYYLRHLLRFLGLPADRERPLPRRRR